MSTYVVGDIQGCYDELQRLLELVKFSPGSDRLWSVGDMVNRGPRSLETLRLLRSLGSAFTGVLGNHDLHFLAVANHAYTQGKIKTLRPLLDAPDCYDLANWVRHLPLAHYEQMLCSGEQKKVLMVHAGIAPGWLFKQTVAFADEVATVLRGPGFFDFLRDMYGTQPDTWRPGLHGMARLRLLTNVLTRIRFCTAAGTLDFSAKGGFGSGPAGYRPWFHFQKQRSDKLLLFGHWAMLNGRTDRSDIQGLDTGCVWGRAMTLLRLEDGQRFQLSCSHLNSAG